MKRIIFSAALILLFGSLQVKNILLVQNQKIMQRDVVSMEDSASKLTATVEATPVRGNYYQRLKQMESDITSRLKSKNVTSCRAASSRSQIEQCRSYHNITNVATHLFVYNPAKRDKYICGGEIVIGPEMIKPLTIEHVTKCGDNLLRSTLKSHSYPHPPTMDNRHKFPGILVQQQIHEKDDSFSTDAISKKTSTFNECDVKCSVGPRHGIINHLYVYGTPWRFTFSMEGEKYYPQLKVEKDAWKRNQFFVTTSFQSEVLNTYVETFRFNTTDMRVQSTAVNYSTAIKGASFLAKNCKSKNNRERVVQQLINSTFRVDSLSRCLHNAEPPEGVIMASTPKSMIMQKYLFHLAFENQNTDDYITEKLWLTLDSGTVPVYFGAPNIKEHGLPINSMIHVSDYASIEELAEHLTKVANNETLYNSYHTWRKQLLPEAFLEKYLPIRMISKDCRVCRWAHAKKYGLGWDHPTQTLRSTVLSREVCVDNETNLLRSPVVESWWELESGTPSPVKVVSDSIEYANACPLSKDRKVRVKRDLIRSVWSSDGTTDMLLEGMPSESLMMRLVLPITQHGPVQYFSIDTAWIQDDKSRITLVIVDGSGNGAAQLIKRVQSGSLDIEMKPDLLPLRIRVIVEDKDLHHEGADDSPTYYGQAMIEDVSCYPELFALNGTMNQTDLERFIHADAGQDNGRNQLHLRHQHTKRGHLHSSALH